MEGIYQDFDQQGNEDNKNAYKALLQSGMKAVTPDEGQVPEWRKAIQASNRRLANDGEVSVELLEEVECYLSSFRAGNQATDCTR